VGRFKIEITKFTLVGAANFLLTFIVFTSMLKGVHASYLASLAVAWIVGVFFSYRLNFVWVFRPQANFQLRARFAKFLFASFVSVTLNMLLLSYLVERVRVDPLLAQTALIPLVVAFNFSTAKFWSLRRDGGE
jgi:putative flippase GtrA